MAVGLWRRVGALAAAAAMVLTAAACSGSTHAAGPDGIQQSSETETSSTSVPSTPVAPVTVAPLTTEPGVDPVASHDSDPGPDPDSSSSLVTPTPTTSTSTKPRLPAATVTADPKLGSTGIAPARAITINAKGGTLSKLTFTNPDGKAVKGHLSKDKKTWELGEPLGFGRTYTVSGVAVNADGAKTKIHGTYKTASTIQPVTTSISPGDGDVVGIAAPVIVRFGMAPQDKALIEKNVKIVTEPKVEGAWAWIRHDGSTYPSLDWRPKKYWPAGTKVHVESNIYGLKFADNWYGGNDVSVDFTIGRNQVVIANAKTHRMTVKRDGKTVWTFDASLGMGDDPDGRYGLDKDLVTRSGIHIVMDKHATYKMTNLKYHYKDVKEYWAVRISNNGEFIHNNPGTSPWQLANANVTHGCINLSWDDAKKYFESVLYGDPVEVTGTSVPLSPSDGDIYDWAIPWDEWLTMSALR